MEIKIRELCKSYGKKKALQNFDATFEKRNLWHTRTKRGREEHADEYIDR